MELNRNQIIRAWECCASPEYKCEECPIDQKKKDDCVCGQFLAQNSLAIFKSQEQKIFELENRLKECENGYEETLYLERAKIKKLTDERDTFREYAYNMQKYVEYIKHNEEAGYEPSAAKAAAEMEMWRVVALQKRELIEENERLGIENFDLICKLSRIKEDTVREFVERLKQRKVSYGNITFRVVPIDDIDQIAKEMLEGEQ